MRNSCFDVARPEVSAGRLEAGRRHAGRHAEMKLERRLFAVGNHQPHAVETEHVGDLVRIGDGGDRSVSHCEPRELARDHHRAFDVNVRVDEAGEDERVELRARLFVDGGDPTALDRDRAGKIRRWCRSTMFPLTERSGIRRLR